MPYFFIDGLQCLIGRVLMQLIRFILHTSGLCFLNVNTNMIRYQFFLPQFYFFCFVKLARTVLFILTFAFKNLINLLHKTWFILNIKVFFTNLGATSCLKLLEEILKHQWLILFTCKFDIYRQLYFKIIFLYWYLE